MFLHHLSVEQRQAFVGLAQWLVEADGRIDPLESARLDAIRQQVGVGPPSSGEPMDWAACFSTQRARTSALLELLAICLVDGEYHPAERAAMGQLADAMGVSGENMRQLESWVLRQAASAASAEALMAEGEP